VYPGFLDDRATNAFGFVTEIAEKMASFNRSPPTIDEFTCIIIIIGAAAESQDGEDGEDGEEGLGWRGGIRMVRRD
jgi:hypothetical protein